MAKVIFPAALAVTTVAREGPCDIFSAGGSPCVAAHSVVRALYGNFGGNLYQVKRDSDNALQDVPVLSAGGFANSAVQDDFCKGTDCIINQIYDQSPQGNHLTLAPPGGAYRHPDTGVNANAEKLMVGGHPVYAAYFNPGNGYRNDHASGTALGDEPQTMYMVTSGKHYNNKCCFDYGNAETDDLDDGAATMEAIYFGSAKDNGLNHGGAGKGPWIMADMENALWGADVRVSNEELIDHTFVTAMMKGDESVAVSRGKYTINMDHGGNDIAPCGRDGCVLPTENTHLDCELLCNSTSACVGFVFADAGCSGQSGPVCWTKSTEGISSPHTCRNSQFQEIPGHWAIKGGNSQEGELKVYFDGKRAPGYAPMKKQGSIILGIGGDNSAGAMGTFYEGVMTKGYSSDATDNAVQANIVAAGYAELGSEVVV